MLKQMPRLGLDPRLLRHGLARPARPGRVLGRVPGDPRRPTARPSASVEPLFRTLHGDRRGRHRARRRLPAVAVPAHRVRRAEPEFSRPRRTSPTPSARPPTDEHHDDIHDVELVRVDRLDAAARRHRRARRYPQLLFKIIDPAVTAPRSRCSGSSAMLASLARRWQRLRAADASTTTRSRPRSSSARGICLVLLVDLFVAEQQASGSLATIAGFVLLARVAAARHARPSIGDDVAVDVRRPLRGRRLQPGAQGAVPARRLRRRAAVDQRHRGGRLLPGRVLRAAAQLGARHGDDGVGRDLVSVFVALELLSIPPTCWPRGASATARATRPASSTTCSACSPSAVMLYGMCLLYGATGTHQAHRHRRGGHRQGQARPASRCSAIVFVIVGFAFKVVGRAVPHLGARHLRGRAHAGHRVPRRWRRRRPGSSPCSLLVFVAFPQAKRRVRSRSSGCSPR